MVTLFLCGDVMTGRGIDQCLSHPSRPTLHEPWVRDARVYVELAEKRNGPIGRDLEAKHIWGDALEILKRVQPEIRLINLETAITRSEEVCLSKEVHYRMHPKNLPILKTLQVDCCSLANNHSLDWGKAGLLDSLNFLEKAKIRTVGAGKNLEAAQKPVIFELRNGGRVLIFGAGSYSSGIPIEWRAEANQAGLFLIDDSDTSQIKAMDELV